LHLLYKQSLYGLLHEMIDDIDYLLENSEKESMTIYVDSSLRNSTYYPYPNEYTIQFDQPFKNVYGFEILDGAIPNTMYNIDVYNNDIYFSVIKIPSNTTYDPIAYFKEISSCATFADQYNNLDESFIVIGDESSLSAYIGVPMAEPKYSMYFRKVINDVEIVKKANIIEEEFFFFTFENTEYAIARIVENAQTIAIIETGNFYLSPTDTQDVYDVIYFENYQLNKTVFNQISTSGNFILAINNYHKYIDVGNYDVLTLSSDLSNIFNIYQIEVQPLTSPPIKSGKVYFSSANFFIINGAKGKLIKNLGFDILPQFVDKNNSTQPWKIGSNTSIFASIIDTSISSSTVYKIQSPGLVNLLGERFCILRIRELEDHLYGSYSYMSFTPGIGLFKMSANSGGVTNLRFDFTNLVRKPFHPIGKLSKLSLRFETMDGNLYDFKGVSHQLLFAIKFLVPTSKVKFSKSILNPNYNPDLMNYMSNQKSIAYKEDSDDEQEFDDQDYYETYKKELDKYDYSSSSCGSNDEESVEESEADTDAT
jgi:hypothetical protein